MLAFKEAHDYVGAISRADGAHANLKKSFPRKSRADHRRVDIEVLKGVAFVQDTTA